MSALTVVGGATGTATVTLIAPATSTNRTLTLPDSTDTLQTIGGVLTQFNASGSAPVYACRAWVNFNGTGTVAIRASGNVSSITDNGTGDYTVNFATAMPDANYSASCSQFANTANIIINGEANVFPTASALRIGARGTTTAALLDAVVITVAIFR